MQVRRRSGDMGGPVGSAPRNTATKRKDGPTQVKYIRGEVSTPKPARYGKIKGAVSG